MNDLQLKKDEIMNLTPTELFDFIKSKKMAIVSNRRDNNLLELLQSFERDSRTYYVQKMRSLGLDSEINRLRIPKEEK